MVYSNHFVLCIVVNGKVQKELRNGTVKLPFGTEYAVRLRNKHKNRRAVVKIFIDGENVSGNGYIIPANDSIDIERHNDRDRAFKFVDLDSPDAVDAGKNGPNDDKEKGTIEARFYLERERVYRPIHIPRQPRRSPSPWYPPDPWSPKWLGNSGVIGTGDTRQDTYKSTNAGPSGQSMGGMEYMAKGGTVPEGQTFGFCDAELSCNAAPDVTRSREYSPASDFFDLEDGCTVEGNTTGQRFGTEHFDAETDFVSCRVFLQGYRTDEPVYAHSHHPEEAEYCSACGTKRAKGSAKFCYKCGAKL